MTLDTRRISHRNDVNERHPRRDGEEEVTTIQRETWETDGRAKRKEVAPQRAPRKRLKDGRRR